MWTKNKPTKDGYYWVTSVGQLTGRDYTHPVKVSGTTVFSDGENFSIDSDMFLEWYTEPIPMPAKVVRG